MKIHVNALLDSLAAAYLLAQLGELKEKWRALVYLFHRNLCEAMEVQQPGIAGDAGYDYAVGVLANLKREQRDENTAA